MLLQWSQRKNIPLHYREVHPNQKLLCDNSTTAITNTNVLHMCRVLWLIVYSIVLLKLSIWSSWCFRMNNCVHIHALVSLWIPWLQEMRSYFSSFYSLFKNFLSHLFWRTLPGDNALFTALLSLPGILNKHYYGNILFYNYIKLINEQKIQCDTLRWIVALEFLGDLSKTYLQLLILYSLNQVGQYGLF